jgi:hypothetical protein
LLPVEATFGKKIISFYFCNFYIKKGSYTKKEFFKKNFFGGGREMVNWIRQEKSLGIMNGWMHGHWMGGPKMTKWKHHNKSICFVFWGRGKEKNLEKPKKTPFRIIFKLKIKLKTVVKKEEMRDGNEANVKFFWMVNVV